MLSVQQPPVLGPLGLTTAKLFPFSRTKELFYTSTSISFIMPSMKGISNNPHSAKEGSSRENVSSSGVD